MAAAAAKVVGLLVLAGWVGTLFTTDGPAGVVLVSVATTGFTGSSLVTSGPTTGCFPDVVGAEVVSGESGSLAPVTAAYGLLGLTGRAVNVLGATTFSAGAGSDAGVDDVTSVALELVVEAAPAAAALVIDLTATRLPASEERQKQYLVTRTRTTTDRYENMTTRRANGIENTGTSSASGDPRNN